MQMLGNCFEGGVRFVCGWTSSWIVESRSIDLTLQLNTSVGSYKHLQ
jgi:hypothetical protein